MQLWSIKFTVMLALCSRIHSEDFPCIPKDFAHGSIVCVCSTDYCDTLSQLGTIEVGNYFQLVSSKSGRRFDTSTGNITSAAAMTNTEGVTIAINRSISYQTIIGFGGAFTDAAGINIASLSEHMQKTIINGYFGKNGLEYNLGRVPMAGTDFSRRTYSYDDVANDTSLRYFSLVDEDYLYKLPYIKEALKLQPDLKLIASPWSAPAWMKTNNKFFGSGVLKNEYYQSWANYFVKFLDEYSKNNVTMWAVTGQNEPFDGLIPGFSFNCMGWNAIQQRDWIKNNLGPTMTASNKTDVKIIILDDQRPLLLHWIRTVLSDPEAAKYISGIGLHWYMDELFPPGCLATAHEEFPNYFILATEACVGSLPFEEAVVLGSWERGERYARDIIEDLNHFVSGWMDWNLALDMTGGPNWSGNFVDAPFIIDSKLNVAYKQPMYYTLGHFSKYAIANSVRIQHTADDLKRLEVLTCLRPDGIIIVVILNRLEESIPVNINDSQGGVIIVTIEARSLYTIAYK